ncbi:MAG TPA: hypothetical protein VE869_18030, partial [Gemmatimonas sp.]|nr:hypothetical protein [Gemmatimonas sp.]
AASVARVDALLDSLAPAPGSISSNADVAGLIAVHRERADSALLSGDLRVARAEAGALLSASRQRLGHSELKSMTDGWMLLQQGARLLARTAQQAGEPLVAGAARRLEAAAHAVYVLSPDQRRAFDRLAETPGDGRLLHIIQDRSRPLALRTQAAAGALVRGACMSPREVMFGMTAARRAVFRAIEATLDASGASAINEHVADARVAAQIRVMQMNFDASASPHVAALARAEWPALYLVPAPIGARAQLCRTL